jgi:uncharacterized protein YbjT (DUF2867 family)
MITVLGATGNTGRRIATALLAAGEEVRAVGRSAERLAAAVPGAQHRVGDASDAAFLTEAFRGADAAYVLLPLDLGVAGYHAQQDALGEAITAAARASGLHRLVALSSLGADVPEGTGFLVSLHRQEARLRALAEEGVDVVLLRPGLFFESFLVSADAMREHGAHVDSIEPGTVLPMVATADVAAAAVDALRDPTWSGVVVREVLGPRDLEIGEAVRVVGAGLGLPDLPYVALPDAEMAGLLEQVGLPPGVAALHVEMNRAFSTGLVASAGRTPATTTPTTLEEFAAGLARCPTS